MTEDWRKNIYRMILDYSDLEMQKRIWLGKDPKLESSYDEDISLLFDSFEFDDFIKEWKIEKLNHELLGELIVFRNKLISYNDKVLNIKDRSDEHINKQESLIKITLQKKILISQITDGLKIIKIHTNTDTKIILPEGRNKEERQIH